MLPRRLVLSSSSDEDDEPHNQPHPRHHQESQPQPPLILSQSRNSVNPNPTTPNPSAELLEISDDEEFIDVSENLSPPSPPTPNPSPNPNSPPPPPPPPPPPSSGGCPIRDILWGLGLGLKREWLDSCVRELEQAVPGFGGLGVDAKAKLCFEKFLVSDMNRSGGGVLPENVDRLHLVDLPGPFVLQVDEIVNISNPLKGRYQKAPPGIKRCLKLSMTDGLKRVFGMEYRPIKDLDALAPAGLKVVICNVHIRHGLLILVPEAFEVLGGVVEELEAARQRLVDEVNKLPRGIRTRGGVVPPLRTRATLAAWPSNSAHVAGNTNNMTSEHTTPIRVHNQGSTYVALSTDADQRVGGEFPGVGSEESAIRNSSTSVMDVDELPIPVSTESAIPNQSPQVVTGAEEAPYVVFSTVEEEVLVDTIPNSRANIAPNSSTDVASIGEEIDMELIPSRTDNPMSDTYPNDVLNDEEIPLVDEFEHPLILSGNREIPFTYLASLSAKWTAMKKSVRSVKGIVKCFLTGVKRFEYKDRTFELQAYVDDGSLISEIVIHHDAIQKMIGHSPREVMAALSSSDPTTAQNIRETMRQFQSFLAKFEGKMLIEINEASPLPVALEMNQGCSESDAQLLLRRFRSSILAQT